MSDAFASIRRALGPLTPAFVLVAVQLVFFGVPAGAWIRGVVIGLLTALLAVLGEAASGSCTAPTAC